jgi:hypothetical protein
MRHLPYIVLLLLLLGAVGMGWAQRLEVQRLRESQAMWAKEREELRRKLWDLQRDRNNAARGTPATVAGEGTAAAASAPGADIAPGAETGGRERRERPEGGRVGALMDTPEVQQLLFLQQKAGLDGRYAALFRQLRLSPADLEKFKNLLVEKQTAVMDVFAAARSQGLGGREGRDEIRQLMQGAQAEIDTQIKGLLGEPAYAQFQEYERTQPQRAVVGQLEQRLSYSEAPLSPAQSEQLTRILAQNSPAESGDTRGMRAFAQTLVGTGSVAGQFIAGGGSRGGMITDAAVAQAQGVLSAPQLAALQEMQREQQASADLQQQMRRNLTERARPGADPAQPRNIPRPPGG